MRRFFSVVSIVAIASSLAACIDDPPPPKAPTNDDPAEPTGPSLPSASHDTHDSKLGIEDVVVGTGTEAKTGDAVRVHYVGKLENGTVFDSSVDRGTPFTFILGEGKVIKGWELGVVGMKVGGKRKLVIPPALGYGATGSPPTIPPNATLYFDVELLNVAE